MTKIKVMGKTNWIKTILFNLPKKRKARSLKTIRKDLNKSARIVNI